MEAPLETPSYLSHKTQTSMADLLFKALNLAFSPRATAQQRAPTNRSAAFCKRLAVASINWPGKVVLRAFEFIRSLIARDPKLDGLLSAEDKVAGGGAVGSRHRWEVDDPEVVNPLGMTLCMELDVVRRRHWDVSVRVAAEELLGLGSNTKI
jgi:nucleolar complex protein 3